MKGVCLYRRSMRVIGLYRRAKARLYRRLEARLYTKAKINFYRRAGSLHGQAEYGFIQGLKVVFIEKLKEV